MMALALVVIAGTVEIGFAQGVQTGVLTGVVKDPSDLPVPGATVTATSPALQGVRTTVTDEIGAYIFRGLPVGTYRIRFELSGMRTVEEEVAVPLGDTVKLDATLALATVQEQVTVVAEIIPPAFVTTQTATNFRSELINALPIGRTPALIAELAPGVTDNTPNVGQMAIGGAFAFDSIFLIDGVDTNDNLFGNTNTLFIEDGIEETQVLTSGISAEFGRFGGGVVNLITKSGGNTFSGSFRVNFAKPSWSTETPLERERNQTRSDTLSKFFEGTFGGPIIRDRLWFFHADRYEDSLQAQVLSDAGTSYSTGNNNKRFELKLTATPVNNHRVSGSFLNNPRTQDNFPSINATFAIDPAVLVNRELPNNLWVVNWNGILSPTLFSTFQWSRKEFGFRNTGGTSTNILDSPFLTRGNTPGITSNRHYNAPYFSSNDPEDRNNRQFTGSLSYFFTNPGIGRNDLKVGFEHFRSNRTGGNSQSATGYVFQTDYQLGADGRPVLDAEGHPIPVWGGNAASPAAALTRVQNWISVPGSNIDINTLSIYLQNRWTVNSRVSADLGVRYEKVRTEATGDIIGADTDTWVPRLGVSVDPMGDGRTSVQASYAHYSGRFTERAFARNTTVGTPSLVLLAYTGPNGVGRTFAPGFDLNNYVVIGGNFPTANVFFDEGLHSPLTKEFTVSIGRDLPRSSHAELLYVWRKTDGFIEDFINDPSAAGKVPVTFQGRSFGTFDRVVYRNTDDPTREYQALQLMSRSRVIDQLLLDASWTIQIRNHGNFEGEAANQPGNPELWFDYPEILVESRHFPYGRLNEFQRHKVRVLAAYNLGLGRFGSVDIGPIWRINSGLTYSLQALGFPHTATMLARNPGYLRTSPSGSSANIFFDERGSESFKGFSVLDLALTYGIPVWKSVRPWLQLTAYNVFNNQKLIQWDTSVTADPNSPRDEHGLPTGFIRGANFGRATTASHFPLWASGENGGRTFRVAFGVRF
jgi:outer membrane receptor protein involved in Fe transport